MGFKYDDKAIKCPLFRRVVKTTRGQFIGIQCEEFNDKKLGFDAAPVVRLHTSEDLSDFTGLFCKEFYTDCPCFKLNQILERVNEDE